MAAGGFRYRVRQRRTMHLVPCAPQLQALLACFASNGDLKAREACAEAAKGLHHCMATSQKTGSKNKSSINYLLRKVN